MIHTISIIQVLHTIQTQYEISISADLLQGVGWSGQWRLENNGFRNDR